MWELACQRCAAQAALDLIGAAKTSAGTCQPSLNLSRPLERRLEDRLDLRLAGHPRVGQPTGILQRIGRQHRHILDLRPQLGEPGWNTDRRRQVLDGGNRRRARA